jgi:hypothetical protein
MSLMHNIRNFAEIQLQGVIPWSKFSFPDTVHTDTANCSIEGKAGLYRVAVTSSYAAPPLGNVKFTDHDNGHEINGNNQDATWHEIAEYLKARERGEMRVGLKTHGLRDDGPIGSLDGADDVIMAPKVTAIPVNELPIPPVAFVWYIADPGVWYQNGPALVTRINADGSYNLTVFPDGSEPFYRQNVRERSDGLRNVCWVAYRSASGKSLEEIQAEMRAAQDALQASVLSTRGAIIAEEVGQSSEIAELRATVDALSETISRLKASAFDQRKSA